MIGIFDSGVGGLTVAKEIMEKFPDYDLVYFGDTARTPYGNKSKEAIVKYALEDADFLIKKGAKILVVACNTASALAYGALCEKYPNVPIFEVITPAAEAAAAATKNKRIGIIGTRATVSSGIYEEKLKNIFMSSRAERSEAEGSHVLKSTGEISPLAALGRNDMNIFVESRACPLFVPLIEENWIDKPEIKMIARKYLSGMREHNIDTLILGCTHYPIIKNIIAAKAGKKVKLVDSATALAGRLKKFLDANPEIDASLPKNNNAQIYFSDLTEQVKSIASRVLRKNVKLEQGILN